MIRALTAAVALVMVVGGTFVSTGRSKRSPTKPGPTVVTDTLTAIGIYLAFGVAIGLLAYYLHWDR